MLQKKKRGNPPKKQTLLSLRELENLIALSSIPPPLPASDSYDNLNLKTCHMHCVVNPRTATLVVHSCGTIITRWQLHWTSNP